MFTFILKRAVPLPKLLDAQRYLFIGPHPDDIEVACAPTVQRLINAGKDVSFLIVTDGCMGALDKSLYGAPLSKLRQSEARASAAVLGVTDVRFLPFSDGGMYPLEEAAAAIAKQIVALRPDIVFAPDPDVISECHADHIKTGLAAKMSMQMAPYTPVMESVGVFGAHAVKALALYYTDRPNTYLRISKTFGAREKALSCHKSQFTEDDLKNFRLYFTLRSLRFGFRRLSGKCDGYRVLGPTHMHCFPEAARW